MSVVFHSRNDVLVRTKDGRNVVVCEPIYLVDDTGAQYCVPVGAESDGCSWDPLPPFGPYWLPAVVHDSAYRGTLLRQLANGDWIPAMLSKEQSDLLFLDCMTAVGVDPHVKEIIYNGVSKLGWRAFRNDREILDDKAQ